MKERHIIYGEDDKAMQAKAAQLRQSDGAIEIQLRHARTFADVDPVGHVHIIGNYPHIAKAYEATEFLDGGEYFTPKVSIEGANDDEANALINQPEGQVFEGAYAAPEPTTAPGEPGPETTQAMAERGEQSTDPVPVSKADEAGQPPKAKAAKSGKKAK